MGVVGFLLVIRAVLSNKLSRSLLLQSKDTPKGKAYSNCCDVIIRGINPEKDLLQDQAHVDVICVIRAIVCEFPIVVKFIHVLRHLVDRILYRLLKREQKLNVNMDKLARRPSDCYKKWEFHHE